MGSLSLFSLFFFFLSFLAFSLGKSCQLGGVDNCTLEGDLSLSTGDNSETNSFSFTVKPPAKKSNISIFFNVFNSTTSSCSGQNCLVSVILLDGTQYEQFLDKTLDISLISEGRMLLSQNEGNFTIYFPNRTTNNLLLSFTTQNLTTFQGSGANGEIALHYQIDYRAPFVPCFLVLIILGIVFILPPLLLCGCLAYRRRKRRKEEREMESDESKEKRKKEKKEKRFQNIKLKDYPVIEGPPIKCLLHCCNITIPFMHKPQLKFRHFYLNNHTFLWIWWPERKETLTKIQRAYHTVTLLTMDLLAQTIWTTVVDSHQDDILSYLGNLAWKVASGGAIVSLISYLYLPATRFVLKRSTWNEYGPLKKFLFLFLRFLILIFYFALCVTIILSVALLLMQHTCSGFIKGVLNPFLVVIAAKSIFPGILISYLTWRLKNTWGKTPESEKEKDEEMGEANLP